MYKFFLASRYLRSRPISLVTVIGIFLSVGALVVVISVMSGFLRESRSYIRGTMSDIIVVPLSSLGVSADGERRTVRCTDFETLKAVIDSVGGVTGVAPRFVRPSLIRRADGRDTMSGALDVSNFAVQAVGIDLESELAVSGMRDYLTNVESPLMRVADLDDPFMLPDDLRDDEYYNSDFPVALVGDRRYERLGLTKGAVITLATIDESILDGGGEQGIKPFEQKFFVGGAFRSGHFQFDGQHILVQIDDARDWVGAGRNEVSEIYISVDDCDRRGAQIAHAIETALGRAGIKAYVATWEQKNAIFLGAVKNERTILGFILGFFILIATFNVFANTSIMVTDKTKDIGILVSMGATPGGILGIFMSCGVFLWMIGSVLGAIGGYFFADNINPIKDFIEDTFNVQVFDKTVYNFTEIPVEIDPVFIGFTILGTLILCLIFSFIPAFRASLMDPVRTLRHE